MKSNTTSLPVTVGPQEPLDLIWLFRPLFPRMSLTSAFPPAPDFCWATCFEHEHRNPLSSCSFSDRATIPAFQDMAKL